MKILNGMVKALAVCTMVGVSTVGCNTIGGMGKDINEGGKAISDGADEVHEDIHRNDQSKLEYDSKVPDAHMIASFADYGGSINPNGPTNVPDGSSQTFIATAHADYHVADLVVDKRSMGALPYLFQDNSSSYTFENVAANHVISSSFHIRESR